MTERRLLLVHAHPDDECFPTGATIAKYVAEGAAVTLVTCTRGEAGEIVADDLKHLDADGLGAHRVTEMAASAALLGLTDHRWLGGEGRWRDSGMMGTPENDDPRCFWRADLDEAAAALTAILRETRPQVVVTYDANGDYGHPDHIQAHRVTVAAIEAAADPARYPDAGPPHTVAKRYATGMPKSVLRAGFEHFKASGDPFFAAVEDPDDLPFGTPDEEFTTTIRAPEHLERKMAAMRAHRSQIDPNGVFFALPPELAGPGLGWEHFRLQQGTPGGPRDADGHETDLFGALDTAHGE
ncbi:MAG TPA: N-acetyl-1-D-myo-inositol-2-amino-2-deoxy-alpha-D-glucopyranoside deacetylase [Mycobacteriales bacterium]|jgi:N-acetyl-1-D-myo-inositol-2-amino-2-deoxy-alpha-D-glucopyranoside deacetylase|nr:N-acetyl-1-D-myo-inositol-2-amino-2-deoxy-alpha-D-glucopyranoside deacetylase [Mycobacteriales bacterium]